MDPEKKSLNYIFPTKYVIPKSLKFSHWPSKNTFSEDLFGYFFGVQSYLLTFAVFSAQGMHLNFSGCLLGGIPGS